MLVTQFGGTVFLAIHSDAAVRQERRNLASSFRQYHHPRSDHVVNLCGLRASLLHNPHGLVLLGPGRLVSERTQHWPFTFSKIWFKHSLYVNIFTEFSQIDVPSSQLIALRLMPSIEAQSAILLAPAPAPASAFTKMVEISKISISNLED